MRQPMMTQYNVEFPSEAGLHARLTRLLIDEKVDYQSMVTARVGERTMIQFMAHRDETLRTRLDKLGVSVREELIFQLEIPHRHQELHKLAASLADEEINILSVYTVVEGENMRIVMAVDQPANAVALIRKLGYNPDYAVFDREPS